MTPEERYICAFPGRRDGYEVPAALAEDSRLAKFLTDFYWSGATATLGKRLLPRDLLRKARTRRHPDIPDDQVRVLWSSSAHRKWEELCGRPSGIRYAREGIRFAEAARDEARRHRAHLFLYPPCSHEAFTAAYPRHQPRRVLFQFHPQLDYQERTLREDLKRYPEMIESFHEADDELPEVLKRRDRDSWRDAELIVCASSFTKETLLTEGAEPSRCVVIPYGSDPVADNNDAIETARPRMGFRALFVGTGSQRKGLHHLLRAWNMARLPADSSLTLVTRHYDPGLRPALAASKRTTILSGGISPLDLQRLYATSTLFVMPSLIEGFGAVFLEAMRRGCPVLGTTHTCLPDIGTEAEGVFLTPVADPAALAERLETLAATLPGDNALRRAAALRAAEFTWVRFRQTLLRTLDTAFDRTPSK